VRRAWSMKTIRTIEDGAACSHALLADGWFAGVSLVENADERFVEWVEGNVTLRADTEEDRWTEAFLATRRRMLAVRFRDDEIETRLLSEAERISGSAAAGGERPALSWCERRDGTWRLMLWCGGQEARAVFERRLPLAMPACAWVGEGLVLACECNEGRTDRVVVFDAEGRRLFTVEGRRPRLASAPDGGAYLVVERVESPDSVRMYAMKIVAGRGGEEIPLPQLSDYSFNADLACDPSDGSLYVVCEACAGWNLDHRVGSHREICLWVLQPGQGRFRPAEGTCGGVVPLPREAWWDLSWHNLPTVFPRVVIFEGGPAVAYRRIHYGGHRSFGWHAYLRRFEGGEWAPPVRISEQVGFADVAWGVLACDGGVLAFLPSCDVLPAVTHEEAAAGHPFTQAMPRSRQSSNCRIEIVRLELGEDLGGFDYPTSKLAPYVIPPRIHGICPAPPEMKGVGEGRRLVWADMHPHTAYSKCMAYDDGFPQDVIRYQRDVLGCEVLCLVDHWLGAVEFLHVYDWLEMEAAGRHPVVYGTECGPRDAHHINTYAIDRTIFERLRQVMALRKNQAELFPYLKENFPPYSILLARHNHGRNAGEFGYKQPRTVELYDRELEWAMEAMQLRGDMMVELNWKVIKDVSFPNNYLDAGARIALLGGTDHANPPGPNHFCLTGLWVKELTAQGVFEAIRQRKTLACSNAKVAIWPVLEGKPLGEEVELSGPVRITVHLSAGTKIQRVCLMRDGQLLDWKEVGAGQAVVELLDESVQPGYHWYVVTVQADSVIARQPATAHASPFFVTVR